MKLTTTYKGYKIVWSRYEGCQIFDPFNQFVCWTKDTKQAKIAIERCLNDAAMAWHVG